MIIDFYLLIFTNQVLLFLNLRFYKEFWIPSQHSLKLFFMAQHIS